MRFLHLIRPVMVVLPEVQSPDRKVRPVVNSNRGLRILVKRRNHSPPDRRAVQFFYVDARRKCTSGLVTGLN